MQWRLGVLLVVVTMVAVVGLVAVVCQRTAA
jgi:hypothetical protein